MAKPRVDFDRLGDTILVFMYEQFMADGPPNFSSDEVSKAIPSVPLNAVTLRLRELAASTDRIYEEKKETFDNNFFAGLIGTGNRGSAEPRYVATGRYRLTRKGIDYVAALKDEFYDLISNSLKSITPKVPEIPASDRYVSRNDNQNAWDQVTSSLDQIIAEFKADHCLDNELGPEKKALVSALEGGRQLFEDTKVNVRIGIALTLEPLRRIASRYDQAIAAAVATTSLDGFLGLVNNTIHLLSQLFG